MALLLNKQYKYKGLIVPTVYLRFQYYINANSDSIQVDLEPYADKLSFKEGYHNILNIPELSEQLSHAIPYTPAIHNHIILQYLHDSVISAITKDVTRKLIRKYDHIVYDMNTSGDVVLLDDSNNPIILHQMGSDVLDALGNHIYDTVIDKVRMCELDEVSIIDIN